MLASCEVLEHIRQLVNGLTTQEMNKERRLALLLADGTGDFDFVRALALEEMVYLEGHVKRYEHKQRAEELTRYVGFAGVRNALRVYPEAQPHT